MVGCIGLELREPGAFRRLGDLGGDHVEDPSSDPAELLRPELVGPVDEVGLGPVHRLGIHVGGQGGERAVDHVRLRQRRRAVAHSRREQRPVAVQRHGEAQVGAGVGVPGAHVLRQPPGCVLRRGLRGEVTRAGEDPQPQLGELGLGSHELVQRRRLLLGRHERRVGVSDGLDDRPDVGGSGEDRVSHDRPPHDNDDRSTALARG